MKKFSTILPGAIALLLVAAPFAAQARPSGLLAQQTQQQQPKRERAYKLNLTDTQKQQAKAIRDQTRDAIVREVLNQGQRDQYNAAVQSGKKGSWRSLNLSPEQKTEIRNRMNAARERIEREVLTQDQRNQLQQRRAQFQQRRNQRGQNGTQPGT